MDAFTQRFGAAPAPVNSSHYPARHPGHRRAHSESFLLFPSGDAALIDHDAVLSLPDMDFPSLSDDSADGAPPPTIPPRSARSADPQQQQARGGGSHARRSRAGSMDVSTSPFDGDPAASEYARKAMADDKLAELALMDPRRAKRILANRQSAARSKERKIRYTSELERKVQTLQAEATTLSAKLTLLQRDVGGLTAENRELNLRLQDMKQQAHLREALNEALSEEVQRLKIATGELQSNGGGSTNGPNASGQHPDSPPANGPPPRSKSIHDFMEVI